MVSEMVMFARQTCELFSERFLPQPVERVMWQKLMRVFACAGTRSLGDYLLKRDLFFIAWMITDLRNVEALCGRATLNGSEKTFE